MKSDELIEDYCFDATDNQTKAVYPKDDVDASIDELKEELNRAKASEDVLCTDNRNLLDKVKKLENHLRENAEHFKRNEAQILENAEKELRHHKYKRCLAMARICYMKSWSCLQYISPREKYDHWKKWQTKWTELAYKFKEGV